MVFVLYIATLYSLYSVFCIAIFCLGAHSRDFFCGGFFFMVVNFFFIGALFFMVVNQAFGMLGPVLSSFDTERQVFF